jgi:bifunctional DNase/RNase
MPRRLALPPALLGFVLSACAPAEAPVETEGVAVRVAGLVLDEAADSPVVILEEVEGERRLPIWIGLPEAQSIAAGLDGEEPLRPNSHDLSKRLIEGLEGKLQRVVVTSLRDGVYFARIDLARDGRTVPIDARPSDAIAIALRLAAPLFVEESLFDSSGAEMKPRGREIRAPAPGRQVDAWRL